MTPREYLKRIDALLAAGEQQAILDLAGRYGPEVHPRLTDAEMESVGGVLECCAMAVQLETQAGTPEVAGSTS
jgi:hypothetical protein